MPKSRKIDYYRGIRGIQFIWHGTNSDPELSYDGKTVNYWDVEDTLWEQYKDERKMKGLLVTDDEDLFTKYCHQNADYIKDLIVNLWNSRQDELR